MTYPLPGPGAGPPPPPPPPVPPRYSLVNLFPPLLTFSPNRVLKLEQQQ